MNHINLPQDPKIANKVIDSQSELDRARLERGLLGIMFGGRSSVPNNVAGLVVALGMIIILWGTAAGQKETVTVGGGLVTGSLGFLFGRASKE